MSIIIINVLLLGNRVTEQRTDGTTRFAYTLVSSVECTFGYLDNKWCVREREIFQDFGVL